MGKKQQMKGTDDLLVLQTFNFAYDYTVFPSERHGIQPSGRYLLLSFTGARPGEIVDEKKTQRMARGKTCMAERRLGPRTRMTAIRVQTKLPVCLTRCLSKKLSVADGPKHFVMMTFFCRLCDTPKLVRTFPTMANKFIHHKEKSEDLSREYSPTFLSQQHCIN